MNREQKRKENKRIQHNAFTKAYEDPKQRDQAMQSLFGERWINFKRMLRAQKKKINAERAKRKADLKAMLDRVK